MMIGTNDVAWWCGETAVQLAERHAALIDAILAQAPDAWLLVASIPPESSQVIEPNGVDRATLTVELNAQIETRVQARASAGARIKFVDVYSALTVNDLRDGIHPTESGYEKLAQAWFEALVPLLPESP